MSKSVEKKKSGLATAGLVLGIIGICLSFIPILNNASFFLGILAFIFGIIPFIKKESRGKAIAAIILGVLSIVITLSLQSSWSKALDDISNDLDEATGDKTEEVLKNIDVEIGEFQVIEDEYGSSDTKLVVKVKNNLKEKKSFSISIEAVSEDGSRIETDTIYTDSLGPGQQQEFETFNIVSSDKIDALRNAKFKIYEASKY